MINYHISYTHPHRHFVSFDAVFPNPEKSTLKIQLPSWRPGRYELGMFAKNIRNWRAWSSNGQPLSFSKITRDCWEIESIGESEIRITYEYYAAELNAGSTFLDGDQLYINPVNCFFYISNDHSVPYTLSFELPETYEIACGLRHLNRHTLSAENFDELADCPLIASAALRHLHYTVGQVNFRVSIQGEHRLDEELLLRQFESFSRAQIDLFGSFPADEYHFLFQFTPYFVRHGVEHRNSTVIAMGPVADFLNENWYERMLGISSHELFHTWNVKAIRPIEMQPYRFDQENYSRLGYVAEGVTTYYGDLILTQSGVMSVGSFLDILSRHFEEHFDNPGRHALSVAESSFDTWLDGYVNGVPGRKVSIYNEGCLIAWMCDARIRWATQNKKSLDDVMRLMNSRFGTTGIGYSESDYFGILEEVSGVSFSDIRSSLINGTGDYSSFLQTAANQLALQWKIEPVLKWSEASLGFSLDEGGARAVVTSVVTDSPGDHAGLWLDDELITVNGIAPYRNIQQLLRMNSGKEIILGVVRKYKQVEINLREDGKVWRWKHQLSVDPTADQRSLDALRAWTSDNL